MTSSPQQTEPPENNAPNRASTLTWLIELVGAPAVGYVLYCETATLAGIADGSLQPSEELGQVIETIEGIRRSLPDDLGQEAEQRVIAGWLSSRAGDQPSPTQAFRTHLGATSIPIATTDEIERSLAAIAEDVFGAFLLPDDVPKEFFMPGRVSIHATRAIFGHPKAREFSSSILEDSLLGPIFETVSEHSGHTSATIYRNTGAAGSIQLSMLPELLLGRAWNGIDDDDAREPRAFIERALDELRNLRNIFKSKAGLTKGRLAFTGVLLPPHAQFAVNAGIVREVTEKDRKLVPPGLEGRLSGTDSSGVSTTINYDGDVLLEIQIPLRIRIKQEDSEQIGPWPEDMRLPLEIAATMERLRFALMLAVERDTRVLIIPTWQRFEDPFNTGANLSWSDPRQGAAIMPYQLTELEVAAWADWYEKLNRPSVRKIELALTRILRAVAERREPSDVLIDSVIAWENLFGTKEGEPTFRISTCLAVLLKATLEERTILRSKLSKIYGLRSNIVHGSAQLKPADFPLCHEALDVAISAVRTLVLDRTDILDLSDGAQRSSTLLLGG